MQIGRPKTAMPPRRRPAAAVALLLAAGALLATGVRFGSAQGMATPSPSAGVTVQVLGTTESAVAPGRTLLLQRRMFEPGADSGTHAAPGPVVIYVEAGSVTFRVDKGAALMTKAGAKATETIAEGKEATLNRGDTVAYDQGVVHDVSNPGNTQAVTVESRLNPSTSAAAATPTP